MEESHTNFNSRPREGANDFLDFFFQRSLISIPAPARGRTGSNTSSGPGMIFQFPPPRGGERPIKPWVVTVTLFQFPPPRGGELFK